MDINFFDQPDMTPQPRDKMKVTRLSAKPYEDQRRVRIEVGITPFTPANKPNLNITTYNEDDIPVGEMTIIETMQHRLALTLHIREPEPSGQYKVKASLYYEPEEIQHSLEITFELSE